MILPLLSRGTENEDILWFPYLTNMSLLAYDGKDVSHLPEASQEIEAALVSFLGTHAQHHRDASPMEILVLRGITISRDIERQLRALIKIVEASTVIPLCSEIRSQISSHRFDPRTSQTLQFWTG